MYLPRIDASAGRMVRHATLTVDPFHVVQLAVKATCAAAWSAPGYGRGPRGRSGDPEYSIKGLLVRNPEHLSAAQFTKIIDTLDRDR